MPVSMDSRFSLALSLLLLDGESPDNKLYRRRNRFQASSYQVNEARNRGRWLADLPCGDSLSRPWLEVASIVVPLLQATAHL